MKKIMTSLMAVSAAFGFAATASANEFQVSGGWTYMYDSADTELSFTAATVRGAYYFTDVIGVELEASTGLSGADNYSNSGIDFELDKQFGGYVVGHWPAGESGEFFLRGGLRSGTLEASRGNQSASADYDGFSIGGGYTYFFENNFGIRGDITTSGAGFDGGLDADGNLTSFSISLAYRFNN